MTTQSRHAKHEPIPLYGAELILPFLREAPVTHGAASTLLLEDLVLQLLDMDECEASTVASLAGDSCGRFQRSPDRFHDTLLRVIQECRLLSLFSRDPEGEHHRSVHPAAYNRRAGEPYPAEMATWRADFRAMNPEQQMLVATLIWMYQGGSDSTWLRRVPCTWRASEALQYLQDAGYLERWLALVAHYVSW